MICQNFENIKQTGTSQIEATIAGFNITPHQFYFVTSCLTLTTIIFIICVSKLVEACILRINFITPKLLKHLKEQLNK